MQTDEKAVRAALELRFRGSEYEVERLMGFYEGRFGSVAGFFRVWLEERLAEQASWMLEYIDIDKIAGGALAGGHVWTMPAPDGAQSTLYVFLFKPST